MRKLQCNANNGEKEKRPHVVERAPILDVFRMQKIAPADEKEKALGRSDFSNQNLIQITPSVTTHPSSLTLTLTSLTLTLTNSPFLDCLESVVTIINWFLLENQRRERKRKSKSC